VNGGAAQDAGTAEGAGAGIGILIVGIGVALYCWRSYVVHGALPCQRNRKREIFELKQQATREAEARMQADTEDATLVNPAATAGKGALTVRMPKAAAAELRLLREQNEALRAAAAAAASAAAAAAQQQSQRQTPKAQQLSFAPVPFGGAAPPAPPAQDEAWAPAVDPASGRTYYFNKVTKETSWVRPAGV